MTVTLPNLDCDSRKIVTWYATAAQMDRAVTIARRRYAGHTGRRSREQEIGVGGFEADLMGALGEVLVMEALIGAGYPVQSDALDVDRPLDEPDFVLKGLRFDVKSVGPSKKFACVNEMWLTRMRDKVDRLIFIKFTGLTTGYALRPVPMVKAAAWSLRADRHSPYRSVSIETLPPLRSLSEITAW